MLDVGSCPARSKDEAEVRLGDVLVTLRGPVNAAAPVIGTFTKPLFATLELAVLRPSDLLDAAYLAWFINLPSTQAALASSRTGGAVARLPLPALQALRLSIPPLGVQHQIAAVDGLAREEALLSGRLQELRAAALQARLVQLIDQQSYEGMRSCTR
jgi:hypothetical protein